MRADRRLPNIGWDPTPGDVKTRDLAKNSASWRANWEPSCELQRIECGAWKGKTAVAFTEHISTDVTPLIKKSHDSFDKASRALHRWAGELQDFQDEADQLEKTAGNSTTCRMPRPRTPKTSARSLRQSIRAVARSFDLA